MVSFSIVISIELYCLTRFAGLSWPIGVTDVEGSFYLVSELLTRWLARVSNDHQKVHVTNLGLILLQIRETKNDEIL